MAASHRVDPLQTGAPIVNKEGAPAPLFLRQWENLVRLGRQFQSAITPNGGTTGQVLTKLSATDFDTGWSDPGAMDVSFPFYDSAGVLKPIALVLPGPLLPFFLSDGSSSDIVLIPA